MMYRRSFSALMLMLLLIDVFIILAFDVKPAKSVWTGIVYIQVDGSIDPPDAPIITWDKVTYTMTDEIRGLIRIHRNNVVLDGNGHGLLGNGSDYGIYLDAMSNVTIRNLEIRGFLTGIGIYYSSQITLINNRIVNNGDGIYLEYSSHNTLIGNQVSNNNYTGIFLRDSSKNIMKDNRMENNRANFGVDGYYLENDIDSSNTVNGKPIYYWINQSDRAVPLNAGYVALINCTGITVKYLEISNNSQGIVLINTRNSVITKNKILNASCGIRLYRSSFNIISENIFDSNHWGAMFKYSENNTISENVLKNLNGIHLIEASNNTFYHNIFNNNMSQKVYGQVYSFASTNIWDKGYPLGGNYWNDYSSVDENRGVNQNIAGSDGIGDSPYIVRSPNNIDRYPLMTPPRDSDGDGLWDEWETRGIDFDRDGIVDLTLPGANPQYKDLYIEIDYMGSDGTHDHRPDPDALNDVIAAFRNAPVQNPNGTRGIALHIEVDEEIPHQDVIHVWSDFDAVKRNHFGTAAQRADPNSANILEAKRLAYRYCLFIHQYALWNGTHWVTTTSSGIAELPGNDFIVSLGAFTNHRGTRDEQAGTFMHELGHTLGLRHGGGDNINGKPNYLSIMSYTRQFSNFIPNRRLDYSREELPTLDENSLNESLGISGPAGETTVFGIIDPLTGNCRIRRVAANGPIDWNMDGDTSDSNLTLSVNYYWELHPTLGWIGFGDREQTLLQGYNDWANLQYCFRHTAEFADGVHLNVADNEITWETVELMRDLAATYLQQGKIYLEIVDSKDIYNVGENFTVQVKVTSIEDCYGVTFSIWWNATLFNVTAPPTQGNFLEGTGIQTLFTYEKIDYALGFIRNVNYTRLGHVSGVNVIEPDEGLVATIEFTVVEAQVSYPLTGDIKLVDTEANPSGWISSPATGLVEYYFREMVSLSLEVIPEFVFGPLLLLFLICLTITILVAQKMWKRTVESRK